MTWRKLTLRSITVAAVIALAAPAMWFIVAGETRRTPTIEKAASDKMTETQRKEWIDQNAKPVSPWEHAKGTPGFIVEHWRGYLQASIAVFAIVLVLNSAFLTGGKNEP